jgi:hypothetical protein
MIHVRPMFFLRVRRVWLRALSRPESPGSAPRGQNLQIKNSACDFHLFFLPCPRSRCILLPSVISTYANLIRFSIASLCFALALHKNVLSHVPVEALESLRRPSHTLATGWFLGNVSGTYVAQATRENTHLQPLASWKPTFGKPTRKSLVEPTRTRVESYKNGNQKPISI